MITKHDLEHDLLAKELNMDLVNGFFEDFSALITMVKSLDAAWSEADNELYEALEVFKEYVVKFNEKYPGLHVKFTNTMDQGFRLFVFFPKEKSLIDIFSNAAGKIAGLAKMGTDTGSTLPPTEINIKTVLSKVKDKLVLVYNRAGSRSIILEMDKKEKMPELIFSKDTVDKHEGPEFLLCAYYAARDVNSGIDLKPIKLKFPSIASSPNVDNVGPLKG